MGNNGFWDEICIQNYELSMSAFRKFSFYLRYETLLDS